MAQFQGDLARAAALHEEGLALFQELGDTAGVARSLNYLATVAQEQGDLTRAAALYEKSLALDRALGYPESIVCALEGLAATAVAGQPARAARLFGVAAALREAIGLPLLPTDLDRYDRAVAEVRRQMDKDAFAAAWDAGTSLSLEQAVAMALAVTDGSEENARSADVPPALERPGAATTGGGEDRAAPR
jgi:tetratricopeptide (TPR) repeat protein